MTEKPEQTGAPDGWVPSPLVAIPITLLIIVVWFVGFVLIELAFILLRGQGAEQGLDLALTLFVYSLVFCILFWKLLGVGDVFKEIGLKLTRSLPVHWLGGALIGGVGCGLAFALVAVFGGISLEMSPPPVTERAEIGTFSWLAGIIFFILYAGEEEVFSRGLIYPFLKRSAGVAWAVIASSIVFSLFHLLNNEFSLLAFLDIILAGAFLALMRELTGNLWLAWGAHFGWNFSLVAAGVPVSGMIARLNPQNWHTAMSGPDRLTGGAFGPEGGLSGIVADTVLVMIMILLIVERDRRARVRRS